MSGHTLIRNDDTGVVSTSNGIIVGTVPDASGDPDGDWLMTSGGAAVWVPAAADLVPIADAGGYFTSTDVEGALQELGAAPSGGVPSVDGITSAVTLVAGTNITITDNSPSPGDIKIDAAGGGGSVWTQKFYDDGSSLAAWTSRAGTWASSGGAIVQSDTSATDAHLERTTGNPYPLVAVKMVASVTFPVSGAGGGSQRAGFCLDHLSGSGIRNGEITVWLRRDNSGAGLIEYDLFGSGGSTQAIQSLSLGTAYSLTVVRVGNYFDVYVDGVLKCSFEGGGSRQNYDTVSLVTRTAKASFDDIYLYAALGP